LGYKNKVVKNTNWAITVENCVTDPVSTLDELKTNAPSLKQTV